MRLDWFLPMLRKPKPNVPLRPIGHFARFARRIFPAACFSDRHTKRRGFVRRFLRKLGPVWLSTPVRRMIQSVCFVAFLWFFFSVCWPYSARPARSWAGWIPVEVDVEAGRIVLASESDEPGLPRDLTEVYAVDESAGQTDSAQALVFRIDSILPGEVTLTPSQKLSVDQWDEVSVSIGPWTFNERPPDAWPSHYADNLARKEHVAAEFFLVIDPLVSLSTAVATRSWVWSLACAGIILIVCVVIPRGFCGYLCPLGTLIDVFDWLIGKRVTRFRVAGDGWWVHIKYYLLLGMMVAATCGVLLTGFVAAIPVITRGMLFTASPLQNGFANGWHQVPPFNAGHVVSLILFFGVLGLGLLRPRFWCKYVCPSGAVFSLGNLFRVSERKVESTCINCNKCVEICPFDAIKPDFTTRTTDCTLCQSCGGVCPTHAIKFVGRWEVQGLKIENDPPTHETPIGRRGFLAASVGTISATVGGLAAAAGAKAFGANPDDVNSTQPVRPPGSLPEPEFLQACIRCGECFQSCPSDVLQPMGFLEQGVEGLWTPKVEPDWAGCASSCNACGQVCPTGAIRALPLVEKKAARMGLAIVNAKTCLPFADLEACQLCVDECTAAGYNAIEFMQVHTRVDDDGHPVEGTGYLAPVVLSDKCVGCGLCQTRCYGINVAEKSLLAASAIVIEAGGDREDRIMSGSYVELQEQRAAATSSDNDPGTPDNYLPDFLRR
jgi:ferredoxin